MQWQPELIENREPRCRIPGPMSVFPTSPLPHTLLELELELQPCGRRKTPSVASIHGVGLGTINAPRIQGATVLSVLVTTRRRFRSPQGHPQFFLFRGVLGDFEQALTSAAAQSTYVHANYVLLASQLRLPCPCWMAHEDRATYIDY